MQLTITCLVSKDCPYVLEKPETQVGSIRMTVAGAYEMSVDEVAMVVQERVSYRGDNLAPLTFMIKPTKRHETSVYADQVRDHLLHIPGLNRIDFDVLLLNTNTTHQYARHSLK